MLAKDDDYGAKAFSLAVVMTVLCFVVIVLVPPLKIYKNGSGGFLTIYDLKKEENTEASKTDKESNRSFRVTSVIDGDTIKIDYFGAEESVRLIGINTPEVESPYTKEECYGKEASAYAKEKLEGKYVTIASDDTQDNRDKYNRLLRYVSVDGDDFGSSLIMNGYAYEYTYNKPYAKRGLYKEAQEYATYYKKGLWGVEGCAAVSDDSGGSSTSNGNEIEAEHIYGESGDCNIKGNISINTGEKIYHVPGQEYYDETVVSPEYGERWFCSEEEARAAGWRRANGAVNGMIEHRTSEGEKIEIEENKGSASDETFIHEGAGYREVEDKSYHAENEDDKNEGSLNAVDSTGAESTITGRAIAGLLCFLFATALIIMWIVMITSSIRGRHEGGVMLSILLLPTIIAILIAISQLTADIVK